MTLLSKIKYHWRTINIVVGAACLVWMVLMVVRGLVRMYVGV